MSDLVKEINERYALLNELERLRDAARAEVERLTRERDEAAVEVEQLRAENARLRAQIAEYFTEPETHPVERAE